MGIFFRLSLVGEWTGEAFIHDQDLMKLQKTLLVHIPVRRRSLLPTALLSLGSGQGERKGGDVLMDLQERKRKSREAMLERKKEAPDQRKVWSRGRKLRGLAV